MLLLEALRALVHGATPEQVQRARVQLETGPFDRPDGLEGGAYPSRECLGELVATADEQGVSR
jgi:hypothetical protein